MLELATTVQESQIVSDNSLPADQNVEVLKSTVRLLQLALDSQFQEVRIMTEELNDLEEESKGFDERERRLQDENDRMREMRDRDAQAGDAVEMRRKIEDLTKQRDIERNNANQLRERQESCDRRVIAAEDKVQVLDNKLRDSEEKGYRLQQDLGALQREHEQLRETFDRMSNELASAASKNKMDDNSKQQGWKLERLSKENRALELQNTELRKQLTDIKAENLEVSEAIVLLDDEVRGQRSNASDVEARIEELVADKAGLISIGDQLRVDIQDKMALLDEFEDKFARQYSPQWRSIQQVCTPAQVLGGGEAGAARSDRGPAAGGGQGGGGGAGVGSSFRRSSTHFSNGDDESAEQMREALDEAKEKEILLLEAYEQLEQDVGKEVDRALARQGEEMARLARRLEFLQGKLEDGYNVGEGAREQQAVLEAKLKDAAARNAMYEKDIYGLPQAVEEIKSLQVAVTAEEGRCKGFILQVNQLSKKVEDLYDENGVLRRLAGVSATAAVDIRDIRTQKESSIAQLRSLNALLERQVADLEEERRKLRMEMKFRAKYHGQAALSLGLSPEQLLLVEQFVDDLKGLRSDEARLVEQLQKRIEFLEVRLSEVMAYADIPPSMRPMLSEPDATGGMFGLGGFQAAGGAGGGQGGGYSGGGGGGGGGGGHIVASQVEAVKASMLKALGQLRQMHQSLGEARSVSSADYAKYVDGVMTTMTDAERAVDIILKDARAAAAAAAAAQAPTGRGAGAGGVPSQDTQRQLSLTPGSPKHQRRTAELAGDAGFLADAMADELREKLRALARQLADLQVAVIAKDAHIAQLVDSKVAMERKFGVPVTERHAEFVTTHEYQDLSLANSSLKEQLISALEELGARELEAGELHDAGLKTQARMQSFADQIRLLYREHAGALAGWKVERQGLEKRVKKLSQDSDGYKAALEVSDRGLTSVREARGAGELHKEFVDTVRRMAMVQIKHAKVARELATSVLCEAQLQERVGELEEEVRDVTSTARGRMRWLEAAADQSSQRAEGLFRELEGAAPLQAYQLLVAKHSRLQGELRRLVEERGDAVAVGDHELFRLRDQLAELVTHNSATADEAAELREKLRLALLAAGASKFGGPGALDGQLAAELVSARVREESLGRRAELVERERDRGLRTLQETQVRSVCRELEERAAQGAADLTRSRATASDLQARLQGGRGKEAVDALLKRVEVAEAAAAAVTRRTDHERATRQRWESERRLEGSLRDTRRHLAETTNLRSALRDAMGRGGDGAQLVGKLHLELDHSRAKESLARNALNRSELQRIELEKEMRRSRALAASLGTQVTAMHEQASWADRQRHEAQATLDISLAGCTEGWKAKLWARKLEQLKARNEALADGLDTSRLIVVGCHSGGVGMLAQTSPHDIASEVAERWSGRALMRLKGAHDEGARVQKLESARVEYQLRSDHAQESSAMLGKGPSEAAREAARLSEQLLVLKLERGRLQREEVLLKEKVHYTERVNAELHELLERYEGEFYGTQVPGAGGGRGRVGGGRVQLEGERAAAVVRAKGLQDEVTKCQERINVLLAGPGGDVGGCTDRPGQGGRRLIGAWGSGERQGVRDQWTDARLGRVPVGRLGRVECSGDTVRCRRLAMSVWTDRRSGVAASGTGTLARGAHSERDALLKQIDTVKAARQEAESLRSECQRLQVELSGTTGELVDVRRHHNEALQRLHEQSEALLYALNHHKSKGHDETAVEQMQAITVATLDELKGRVRERDLQLATLHGRMQEELGRFLAQHQADRGTIETLNQKLFERNDASIDDLRGVLDRVALKNGGTGAPEEVLAMRSALQRSQDNAALLRNKLEQKHAELELLGVSSEKQMRRLSDALAAARSMPAPTPGPTPQEEAAGRVAVSALKSQLRLKDEKLLKLKAAIKELEAKLVGAMQQNADEWVAGKGCAMPLVTVFSQVGDDAQAAMLLLREQLTAEKDSNAALEKELFAVRTRAQKLKNIRESVVDLTTGMSIEAKRQIDDFQKRIKVLEQQNQQLRRHSEAVEVVGALGAARRGGPTRARATARPTGTGSRPSTATPATATARRPTSSSSVAATATTHTGEASAYHIHVDPSYSQQQQHHQQGSASGGGDAVGGGGTHGAPDPQAASRAAIAAWEETKKLSAKIELLRRKLVVKVEEVATHQKEADRRIAQLSTLQAELDKQAAVIRDLQQERTARRAAAAAAATAGSQSEKAGSQSAQGGSQSVQPGSRSIAESAAAASQPARLLEYANTLSAVEGERDTLLLQLGRLQHSAQPPAPRPPAGSVEDLLLAKDADLFGLKLELDQAKAAVKRMRDRMAEIVTANLDQSTGPAPQSSSKLAGPQRRTPAGGPIISVREAELITMIDNLKSALEKAATNVTPTTKYMQEVGRRKDCQKEAEAKHAEAESLRKQLQSSRHMMGEIQASNAELRNTVRDQQTGSSQAGGAAGAAVRGLERSLAQRDAEVSALRQGLAESMAARQAQAGQASQHTGGAGSSSSSGRVAELESQLHESQVENQDLRNELNAFDPGFFEEIEDLKHEHHQLTGRAVEYERTIAQLSAQLGRPVPGSAVMTSGR
ncbi:MAG: hypothetical protein WDW38_001701 [Sanguina aurantia]